MILTWPLPASQSRPGVLTVRHSMSVILQTACCITNPEVFLPIRIGTPPLYAPQPTATAMPIPDAGVATPVAGGGYVPMGTAVPAFQLPENIPTAKDEGGASPPAWLGGTSAEGGTPVVVAECFVVPMGTAVVGGASGDAADDGDEEGVVVVEASSVETEVGMPTLFAQMERTVNDYPMLR